MSVYGRVMSIVYSQTVINYRLQGVVTACNGGNIVLSAGGTTVSTIVLSNPCGTVSGGVLTFTGSLTDPAAANSGLVDGCKVTDSSGNLLISGLSVGIPLSGANVIINNGVNSTLITAGQTVQLLTAQIIGS